jgi:hypothetical protein
MFVNVVITLLQHLLATPVSNFAYNCVIQNDIYLMLIQNVAEIIQNLLQHYSYVGT